MALLRNGLCATLKWCHERSRRTNSLRQPVSCPTGHGMSNSGWQRFMCSSTTHISKFRENADPRVGSFVFILAARSNSSPQWIHLCTVTGCLPGSASLAIRCRTASGSCLIWVPVTHSECSRSKWIRIIRLSPFELKKRPPSGLDCLHRFTSAFYIAVEVGGPR